MQCASYALINIHDGYANMPISSECGRLAQADKIDIGVLCCSSKTKSMENHKIEVIFQLNIVDFVKILLNYHLAICYTF